MTEDPQEWESEGDSDLEDKEIKIQDGGNVSIVEMKENDRPKNQGNYELRWCFILRSFSQFMFSGWIVLSNLQSNIVQ